MAVLRLGNSLRLTEDEMSDLRARAKALGNYCPRVTDVNSWETAVRAATDAKTLEIIDGIFAEALNKEALNINKG